MPRFGDSDTEPIAYRANATGQNRRKATKAKRQLAAAWGDPPLDHHIEELLAALTDLDQRQGEAGADATA
jgi:hypothetical protein